MADTFVVEDRSSGNETVVFYLDEGVRWAASWELHETDEDSPLIDVNGWTARLTARLADGPQTVALEYTTEDGLVNDGSTIAWDISAADMTGLNQTYDVELVVFPDGDEDAALLGLDGQMVMRPRVAEAESV